MNDTERGGAVRVRGLARAYWEAKEAYRMARDTFVRLERAHERGDPGFALHEELSRRLDRVRELVTEVRREAVSLRGFGATSEGEGD